MAEKYERSNIMNERWSLDALYTGFDSPEFQSDRKSWTSSAPVIRS